LAFVALSLRIEHHLDDAAREQAAAVARPVVPHHPGYLTGATPPAETGQWTHPAHGGPLTADRSIDTADQQPDRHPPSTHQENAMSRTTSFHTRSSHGSQDPTPARTAIAWGPFVRHYLEMVVSMVVGMAVLHPLWAVAFDASGLHGALDHATVMAVVMATDMSLGMGAWMRYRAHSWRSIAEMSAAMYVPFVVFLPPVWVGVMSGAGMLTAGHLLMLPTMLALMLWRA
jgi:hypothetical protein